MIISLVRMSVQLIAAGIVLQVVFGISAWYIVIGIVIYMLIMASHIVFSRVKARTPHLQRNILISVVFGSGSVLVFIVIAIVRQDPWYDPRYIIPLGGMIIGNAMNGCALAFERFHSSIQKEKKKILTLLALGATYQEATSSNFKEAFKASFLPQLITMSAMGIVTLPGMMTGQILSGTEPLVAIKYQISIMICIVSSNALVAYSILYLENKELFTPFHQLIPSESKNHEKSYKIIVKNIEKR